METLPKAPTPRGLGIIPAISSAYNIISDIFNRKSEQRNYDKMLEYNSPKAQMQRYREAGLSPYLIYNQGNPGNAPTAQPGSTMGKQEDNIGNYLAIANFAEDIKAKRLTNAILASDAEARDYKNWGTTQESIRKTLDLMTDYPNMRSHNMRKPLEFRDRLLEGSFRQQMNDLKRSFAQESLNSLKTKISGMKHENVVKRVRAKYADEFGMTGSDWTSGIGLLQNLFKGKGGRARTGNSARPRR